MTMLYERLTWALEQAGMTQGQLARAMGVTRATVSALCSGRNASMTTSNAFKAAAALGVATEWLAFGEGDPHESNVVVVQQPAPQSDFIDIPEHRIVFSAGAGHSPTYEEIQDSKPAAYRKDFFSSLGINPKDCRRFAVHGESMEPLLWSGDKILVNTADTAIRSGRVYAFVFDGELRVKRLIRQIDGTVIVHSENPAYPDETVPGAIWESAVRIIGRVIDRSGSGGL